MDIRQLQLFLTIYKHRNITKAAEELYITQQALSKQMKAFEVELGVPLFIRSTRGAAPTEYAESLLDPARQVVETMDTALRRLDEIRRQETVTVRLGLVRGDFNVYNAISPKRIFQWEQAFPQMTLVVREYNPGENLERMLLQGDLDLAYIEGNEHPGLCRVQIASEPAYVLISKENPLSQTKDVTLEDLASQSVLIPRIDTMPEAGKRLLSSYLGREPQFFVFNGTFDQGVEHVRVNEGILFAARSYCLSRNLDGLLAFPFPNPTFVFHRYLVYRKDWELPVPVRQFIKDCQSITNE